MSQVSPDGQFVVTMVNVSDLDTGASSGAPLPKDV
jgi:hypothetical protein